MEGKMPSLNDGGAYCSIVGPDGSSSLPPNPPVHETPEATDAKRDIYNALMQCSGKGAKAAAGSSDGDEDGSEPFTDFGGTIRNLTLLEIVALPNTYSIIPDHGGQSMDTMCMVECDSLLWNFLDYITGTEDMMVALRKACGTDQKEVFGLSTTPIRQMAVSRRKSGARMTVGVPLELVQGALTFLNTMFVATCQEKADDKDCPDTENFSNFVKGRKETLEKMSFANFNNVMFENYLDLIHCEPDYKRRLCVLFEQNPAAVQGVFQVITEMSFGGKMLLKEKRVLSRARKELMPESMEKPPSEEEGKMTDGHTNDGEKEADVTPGTRPKSKLLRLLMTKLDECEQMYAGEEKKEFHQLLLHVKKIAHLKGDTLSTHANKGILHGARGFRHTYLMTLLSEAILVALTLYGVDGNQRNESTEDTVSPLCFLLTTASIIAHSVDEQNKPIMS